MGIKHKKQPQTTQDTTSTTQNQSDDLTFKEYLREFRGRVLWFGGSFIVAAVIGFEFKDIIQGLLTMQIADLNIGDLPPADELTSDIQISLLTGIVVGIPLAFYHTYRFLEPVINKGTSYIVRQMGISLVLIVAAIAYAFMMTIPLALHGMISVGQDAILEHFSTQQFLNFVFANLLVTVAVFQLPLVIIFANSVQSFGKKKTAWLQRIVLPAILIVSWVATPFNSMNRGIAGMLLIAIPAVLAFEAAMLWAKKHAKASLPIAATEQQKSTPLTTAISTPAPQAPVQQHHEQPTFNYAAPKTVLETEQLQPFPDSMFDEMLNDKDVEPEYAEQAPLPPSMEVDFDEPAAYAPAPAQVVQRQAPVQVVAPASIQMQPQPAFAPRPQVVAAAPIAVAPIAVAPVVQPVAYAVPAQPAYRAPVQVAAPVSVPVQAPVAQQAPRFTASFGASQKPLPKPLFQPQPVAKRVVYSQQITETIKPQQASTPPLRSVNAPQPVVPFQMRPAQAYNTIEGLLPA